VIRRPTPFYGIGNGNGFGSGMVGGVGGGGGAGGNIGPKRVQSGSNFMGYSGGISPGAGATSPPISGPQTAPPVLISPNALAAAKQTIQQRIFGGGLPSPNSQSGNRRPATWQPQNSYSTASIFQPPPSAQSPFKMLQQQYQQRCQEDQKTSALFTPPPSPQYAASHALAAQPAATYGNSGSNISGASSNSNSNNRGHSNSSNMGNCNTLPNVKYNVNSRTRPFNHNQAQDTLNTNASASATCALPVAMWLKCKSWQRLQKTKNQKKPQKKRKPNPYPYSKTKNKNPKHVLCAMCACKKYKKIPKQSTQSVSVSCCVPRLFVSFSAPFAI